MKQIEEDLAGDIFKRILSETLIFLMVLFGFQYLVDFIISFIVDFFLMFFGDFSIAKHSPFEITHGVTKPLPSHMLALGILLNAAKIFLIKKFSFGDSAKVYLFWGSVFLPAFAYLFLL